MDYQAKIQSIEKKIQGYQSKHPKRDWKQKSHLNRLWLELAYWQLVEKNEIEKIKSWPLWPSVEKSWEHLKEIYQTKEKWPKKKLKEFLARQKPQYKECLLFLIRQETKPECLKLARWLNEKD